LDAEDACADRFLSAATRFASAARIIAQIPPESQTGR
jgi:hypothetical protein